MKAYWLMNLSLSQDYSLIDCPQLFMCPSPEGGVASG